MTDVTPPPAPPTPAVWEDLLEVFTSPTAVFERRKDDPAFFVAMVLITVVFAVLMFAGWDLMDDARRADAARNIENMLRNNPSMPAETQDQMRAQINAGGGIGRYFIGLIIPLSIVFVGLYAWIAGKMVGAKTTMGQAFMVATYAFTPKIVYAVIAVALAVALPETMQDGQFRHTLGLGLVIDPDTMKQSTLFFLSRFELTTLWVTFLIGLGLKVTGQISTAKAAIASTVVFLLGSVFLLGLLMLGEMVRGGQ